MYVGHRGWHRPAGRGRGAHSGRSDFAKPSRALVTAQLPPAIAKAPSTTERRRTVLQVARERNEWGEGDAVGGGGENDKCLVYTSEEVHTLLEPDWNTIRENVGGSTHRALVAIKFVSSLTLFGHCGFLLSFLVGGVPREVLEVKCTFGLKTPAMKYIDECHSSRCWSQQRLNMGVNLESETRSDNGLSVQKEWCKLRTTI